MSTLIFTKSKHLLPFTAVLERHGEPVGRLLRRAGLPSTCLDDPDTLIPVAREGLFRELAAQKAGWPDLAVAAVQPLELEGLGDFGQVLLRAPTLQTALFEVRRLIATETANLAFELHPRPGGALLFTHRFQSQNCPGEWHNALYVLAWMLKIVRRIDASWSPAEIQVRATAGPLRVAAIEALGSAARFGRADTGFIIPASMLALPMTKSVAAPGKRDIREDDLRTTAPPETDVGAVEQMIRSYASDGWLSIEQASEIADMSVRTLQRRLSAEQATYSGLVERCRAQMAGDLLENTAATIAEIANQLGYDYQGDFTRAFRRWAGVPPSEFRRQRGSG